MENQSELEHIKTDVLIIGAGPAGLACGKFLADKKINFVCIDRKKELSQFPYTCGYSWIDPQKYGLSDSVYINRYKAITVVLPNISINSPVPEEVNVNVGFLDRAKVLEGLHRQASNTGKIFLGESAKEVVENESGVIKFIKTNRHIISAKIFVDCSGGTAFLTKKYLGNASCEMAVGLEYIYKLKNSYRNSITHLSVFFGGEFDNGYGWSTPMGELYNIGIGKFYKGENLNLGETLDNYVKKNKPKFLGDFVEKKAGMLPTKLLKKFHHKNMVSVGDCCGQVNPIVGEGIRDIIDTASVAVNTIEQALKEGSNTLLSKYTSNWHKQFGEKYRVGKLIQKLAQKRKLRSKFSTKMFFCLMKYNSVILLTKFFKGELKYLDFFKLITNTIVGFFFKPASLENSLDIRITRHD